ncbi:MAG: hypothetical protein A3A32_02520 [Candidatus Wildermuthbacteria bacterium RIFCSPLOWO2_01_FULL_48_35]|uniref:Uncharacterized protein n=2 Tax=Candidatus Wildermuthiibacteriota TaxID=1817923 RepID=A0A1G2RQE7_9BACT|nr:MAG: hypothetical protein UY15_C0017G0019 [Parcubacteria group bacterium GW2011_GWA2_47_9]OHA66890.1 MAG: hypothetical protein A3D59_04620 [Candidatus Wildermuthbacteria bacterium RIFCSPHIGHO2_02_FULL_47_17]OHA75063.1 MAG: hypothetical protein A3A32_02520 [Candidatus Wildermuthbacteria bacterium RIFCSPLOWO2_01_FULL_48_35]
MFQLFFTIVLLASLLLPRNALAYIDPGTGNYLIQLLGGIVLGATFFAGAFWKKIKSAVKNLLQKKAKESNEKEK